MLVHDKTLRSLKGHEKTASLWDAVFLYNYDWFKYMQPFNISNPLSKLLSYHAV